MRKFAFLKSSVFQILTDWCIFMLKHASNYFFKFANFVVVIIVENLNIFLIMSLVVLLQSPVQYRFRMHALLVSNVKCFMTVVTIYYSLMTFWNLFLKNFSPHFMHFITVSTIFTVIFVGSFVPSVCFFITFSSFSSTSTIFVSRFFALLKYCWSDSLL